MVKDYNHWNQGWVLLAWNAFPFELKELHRHIVSQRLLPVYQHDFLQQILSCTSRKCEACKKSTPVMYISRNGSLVCGECVVKIDTAWVRFVLDSLYSDSEIEEFWRDEVGI